MILLVAMIGAIVLTFRKRSGIKRQSYFKQISRERSEGVELVDVKKDELVQNGYSADRNWRDKPDGFGYS